jgi:hypothetical protein
MEIFTARNLDHPVPCFNARFISDGRVTRVPNLGWEWDSHGSSLQTMPNFPRAF